MDGRWGVDVGATRRTRGVRGRNQEAVQKIARLQPVAPVCSRGVEFPVTV
jgi:hypothetical protein